LYAQHRRHWPRSSKRTAPGARFAWLAQGRNGAGRGVDVRRGDSRPMTAVLIVDDVPAMAEQYAYDLKRLRGYETTVAKSGRTALERLTRDSVDCGIIALEMPGMGGFEGLPSTERGVLRATVIVYRGTGCYARWEA